MDWKHMQAELMKMYNPTWAEKVSKMSEKQVTAIYLKFKREGKLP